MKTGRTLQEIAQELDRQAHTRKDYIAPQGKVEAKVIGTKMATATEPAPAAEQARQDIVLDGFNGQALAIRPWAHNQLSDALGIPRKYYDRMRTEQPELLARNINTWLQADPDNKRMIRTLDGQVRAVLSPKYRPLDNFDLAQAILPKLLDLQAQVMSVELTETRFYIKAILPTLSDELPAGMTWGSGHNAIAEYRGNQAGRVVAAIVVSNSDVGAGTLRVEPSVFTTWCTNLAIMAEAAMRKYHIGRAFDANDSLEVFRDETRRADDRAFWLKVQDVAAAAFDAKVFQAAVAQIRAAAQAPIVSKELPAVVDVTVKRLALPADTGNSILTFLARGGDLSKWGLSSAITATANEYGDYETATALERAGGEVLAMTDREWQPIATAAA
jgi:hypothetical protein